jgi:hypothetical protein
VTVTDQIELVVSNTNATGTGSLYEAILNANANVGVTDTITFNISEPLVSGMHTIAVPPTGLPAITDTIVIDGTTDSDYSGDPVIRIDGAGVNAGIDGLKFANGSDGSAVRGLIITNFTRNGIQIDSGADGVSITNNWIGTTGNGTSGDGNSNNGINVQGANTVIGGTGVNDGNVITNSGNEGINLTGTGATGTVIQGNIIGLDPDGSTGSGNTDVGIAVLSGAHNTTIGGTDPQARNIISMNYEGIEINSNNNVVQGNYIGTDITGLLARGNRLDDGVEIKAGASGNLIGGTAAGAGNLIAFNALDGVNVVSGSDNTVLGNLIHSNTGLGIDLGTSGVTANDTDDADTGANSLQNYPVITQAEITGTDLTLSGSLDTDGLNTQYRIEFYGNAAGTQDATNGEGRVYLGSITVTTDGSGDAAFTNITLSGVTLVAGDYVTATATRITDPGQVGTDDQLAYGDTSEYAANVVIVEGNNAPVALADSYTAVEGVPYTSQLGVDDLLLNDTDADGDTLTVNTTPVSGPANGSLVLNADGTFTYTPNDNFNGTDSFVYEVSDGNGGSAQATVNVTVQVREIRILLSTQSDVNSSKVPGISNWDAGDVLAIGDPNLTFEPAGSDGSLLPYMDLEALSASGNMTINGMHWVSNDITVGGANSVDLKRGDLLFVSESSDVMTSTNSLAINAGDVIVFRPNVEGDYSSGTFIHLLDQPGTAKTTGITLIEKDVVVGDVTLQAGSFLFTQESVVEESSIYYFDTIDVGAGTTAGTVSTLISSVDININFNNFQGVMIVNEDLYLDGTMVPAGSIVTTLAYGDSFVGNNNILVDEDEIFYLTVTTTTMGSGTTTADATVLFADATVLFDAGDIGLNNNQKKIRSFTIIEEITAVNNVDPVITLPSGGLAYTEGDAPTVIDPAAALVDPDSANFDGGLLRVDLGTSGSSNDKLGIRDEGTGAGQIGINGNEVTYGGVVIGTWAGGTNGSEPLTVLFNANSDVTSIQALLRNITYENTSNNPSENQRSINFAITDGDGGSSSVEKTTVVVNSTNAAPVLSGANDLTSIDEDLINSGGTLVSILISGWVSDVDAGAVGGIAVVGADNTNGSWEFSLDGGTTWEAFGSPSEDAARLLAADATTYVRFVPNADWNGSVLNGITFHAWDQTSGVNGDVVALNASTGSNPATTALQAVAAFGLRAASCGWTTSMAAHWRALFAPQICPAPRQRR